MNESTESTRGGVGPQRGRPEERSAGVVPRVACGVPPAGPLVFGPLPTRRLGLSLGVDTVPLKTCNWNCAYCQLGRTRPYATRRREYVPAREILRQLEQRLDELPSDSVDWVTFVASGEGTLHSGIGGLVRAAKRMSPHPVAVITNGSLLHLDEVRDALSAADAVLPTLDAGDEHTFRRLNRPHPSLTYEQHISGLEAFARLRSRGRLWIEVMLVAGANDGEESLSRLAAVLGRIGPDEVHLTLPMRCPAAAWVQPPSSGAIARAGAVLGAAVKERAQSLSSTSPSTRLGLEEDVLAVITRHPWSLESLPELFAPISADLVRQAVDSLLRSRRIQIVEHGGRSFLAAAEARYGPPSRQAHSLFP